MYGSAIVAWLASYATPKCPPTLSGMPAEIRQAIILQVLLSVGEPSTLSESVAGRVPLVHSKPPRGLPSHANIFVPKDRPDCRIHNGAALLLTSHQLREDTKVTMRHLRDSKEAEFILDILWVKDVGLLPTWLSFPCVPSHIETLRIEFRIVQPATGIIPEEWMEAADYTESYKRRVLDDTTPEWRRRSFHMDTCTNTTILHTLLGYAFNRLEFFPEYRKLPSRAKSNSLSGLFGFASLEPDITSYLMRLSDKAAPYYIDQMVINVHPYEYTAIGDTIKQCLGEAWRHRPDSDVLRFGRSVFALMRYPNPELVRLERERLCSSFAHLWRLKCILRGRALEELKDVGHHYCGLLLETVGSIIGRWNKPRYEFLFGSHKEGARGHPNSATEELLRKLGVAADAVDEALEAEKANMDAPDDRRYNTLKLAQMRIQRGWYDARPLEHPVVYIEQEVDQAVRMFLEQRSLQLA